MSQLEPDSVTSVTEAPPRRRMPAEQRRETILAAALDVFGEGSYHEIALDRVAERAGISKALIYEHFPSKRDLHRALLETYVGELLERVVTAVTQADAGEERLRAGLDAFFRFVEERRGAWRMLVRNLGDSELVTAFDQLRHEVAGAIAVRMAEDAPPGSPIEGLGRERALAAMAEQIVGAVQALANWWDEHRDVPREQVMEMAMDFLWLGLDRLGAGETWGGPAAAGS